MKHSFFLLFLFFLVLLTYTNAFPIIDENADSEGINIGANVGFGLVAQSFKVDANTYGIAVQIPINSQGNPTNTDVNVSIWDANSQGFPSAQLTNCIDVNSTAIPDYPMASYTDFNFAFSINCFLEKDKNYFIVANSQPTNALWFITSTDIYAKGVTFSSPNAQGTAWTRDFQTGKDFFFRLWTDDTNIFAANFTAKKIRDLNSLAAVGDRNAIYDFNFTGSLGGKTFQDANWFVAGVRKKTLTSLADLNFHYEGFSTPGDYNITLILKVTDGNVSQKDLNLTIIDFGTAPKNLNIVPLIIAYTSTGGADVNLTVTFTDGNVNYFVWGGLQDGNRTGQTINADFNVQGARNICVTLNSVGDFNTIYCENFYLTNAIVKIPKNEETLANITPFNVNLDTNPFQTYSGISADQNFWVFYQQNGSNIFFVDANTSFFGRNYVLDFNTTGFQTIIQPFLLTVSSGIDVIYYAVNTINGLTIENVKITSKRPLTTGGTEIVEQDLTDTSGQATLVFIPDQTYFLNFQLGSFDFNATYVPNASDTTKTALLDINSIGLTNNQGLVDVNIIQNGFVTINNGLADFNAVITPVGDTNITQIVLVVDQNGVVLGSNTFNTNVSNGGTFGITVNIANARTDFPVKFSVTVSTNSTPQDTTFTATFGLTTGPFFNILQSLNSARQQDFGDIGTRFLAIFLIGITTAGVSVTLGNVFASNENLFFLIVILAVLFAYISWLPWFETILGIMAGAFYYARRKDIGG